MNEREYRKLRAGARVRLLRTVATQLVSLAAGAEGVVRRKYDGLDVQFDRCEHCGAAPRIHHLSMFDAEIVDERGAAK